MGLRLGVPTPWGGTDQKLQGLLCSPNPADGTITHPPSPPGPENLTGPERSGLHSGTLCISEGVQTGGNLHFLGLDSIYPLENSGHKHQRLFRFWSKPNIKASFSKPNRVTVPSKELRRVEVRKGTPALERPSSTSVRWPGGRRHRRTVAEGVNTECWQAGPGLSSRRRTRNEVVQLCFQIPSVTETQGVCGDG